jgi:hypothetical protein
MPQVIPDQKGIIQTRIIRLEIPSGEATSLICHPSPSYFDAFAFYGKIYVFEKASSPDEACGIRGLVPSMTPDSTSFHPGYGYPHPYGG